MEVFRIVKSEYAGTLYASGRANRWNYPEERIIYTAGSRSLACLENVVHSSGEALQQTFMVVVVYVPDELAIETIHLNDLPDDWYTLARHPVCQQIGSEWIHSQKTTVLKVPSAIIHEEANFVLNPQHPDYPQIQIAQRKAFAFDPRIKS